jgi:hypothetical protein
MGRRGPSPTRVATGGAFWVAPPPITQAEAEGILGASIPAETWAQIEHCFSALQETQELLRQMQTEKEYRADREKAAARLESALQLVFDQLDDPATTDIKMLARRSEGAMQGTLDTRLSELLADAARALAAAQAVVRAAEPVRMKAPTDAEARATLARRLHGILADAGLPCALSDRRMLPDKETEEADLTPFERLLITARVHIAKTPAAMAKWVSEACRKR